MLLCHANKLLLLLLLLVYFNFVIYAVSLSLWLWVCLCLFIFVGCVTCVTVLYLLMARNEEKQFGRLNRLQLQKQKDGRVIYWTVVLVTWLVCCEFVKAHVFFFCQGCSQLDTRSTRHVCRVDSFTKKSTRHKVKSTQESTRHTVNLTQLDTYVNLKAYILSNLTAQYYRPMLTPKSYNIS